MGSCVFSQRGGKRINLTVWRVCIATRFCGWWRCVGGNVRSAKSEERKLAAEAVAIHDVQ